MENLFTRVGSVVLRLRCEREWRWILNSFVHAHRLTADWVAGFAVLVSRSLPRLRSLSLPVIFGGVLCFGWMELPLGESGIFQTGCRWMRMKSILCSAEPFRNAIKLCFCQLSLFTPLPIGLLLQALSSSSSFSIFPHIKWLDARNRSLAKTNTKIEYIQREISLSSTGDFFSLFFRCARWRPQWMCCNHCSVAILLLFFFLNYHITFQQFTYFSLLLLLLLRYFAAVHFLYDLLDDFLLFFLTTSTRSASGGLDEN